MLGVLSTAFVIAVTISFWVLLVRATSPRIPTRSFYWALLLVVLVGFVQLLVSVGTGEYLALDASTVIKLILSLLMASYLLSHRAVESDTE